MFGQNNYFNAAIVLSGTLAASTLVSAVTTLPAFAQAQFNDVQSSYWASQYVQSLTAANIISGFPDGTFRPDEQMTRAQFAAILSSGFSQPAVRAPVNFSDVPADHWASGAINAAYAQGFLSGYPDGTFGLNQPITRLEVLVSLTNGLGLTRPENTAERLAVFSDRSAIPDWAAGAIATATEQQLIVNYPNVARLNPSRNATRAEIAAIAHQALANSGRANTIASPYVPTVTRTEAPVTNTPVSEVDDFSELVALLGSDSQSTQQAAANNLIASGASAVPDLAAALGSNQAQTRAIAAYVLNEIGADAAAATPTLLDTLRDDDELVRALATSALTKVGLDQDVLLNVLVAAVQNESGLVKDIAAEALVGMGSNAVPALGNLLKNKTASSLARQTAATLIGDIGQVAPLGESALRLALPILVESLNDGSSDVRKAAASTLGDFGPLADVAIPALSRALLDSDSTVSQIVAGSLSRIGQPSVPSLTAALSSDNMLTRLYAADALWRLTKDSNLILPTLVSVLGSGNVEARELAALGLTYLGRQALPALPAVRNLLGSDNNRIVTIARLATLILNNNDPAPDLGLLISEPESLNSVPAIVGAVSRLWR